MARDIKIIRFINGEEILASEVIQSKVEGTTRFTNPVRIVVMPNKIDPKIPNVGFAPWVEFSDDKNFTVDNHNVLVVATPIPDFIKQYNSIFGGLVLPTAGGGLIT